MKIFALCATLGAIIFGLICFAGAQSTGGDSQSTSGAPADLCNSIELYVATIDATRSVKEKDRREARYIEAQKEIGPVLKRYNKAQLMDAASSYATYTESVLITDPTNASFSDLVAKRLKSRTALMEICAPFTTQR